MRVWLPVVLAVPVALAGCPALLSDWSMAADDGDGDASAGAAGHEAAEGGGGLSPSGGAPAAGGSASAGGAKGAGGLAAGGSPLGGSGGATGSGGSESGGSSASSGGAGGGSTCSGETCAAPSCEGLPATCGPSTNESCCTSPLVTGLATGETFYRSYDGVTAGYMSQEYPATVSTFRLDKFEVTVGRFRRFKAAWEAGWRPAIGAGKHTHLNGGAGLTNSSGATAHEGGWDVSWTARVVPTDGNLSCDATYQTWTSTAGAKENRPINCVTWYESHAFCIWDGAFLPSEAEWNYAASGGSEQRVYPWSTPAASASIDDTFAVYCGRSCPSTQNVGAKPAGNGRYGQADLAGNVWEWNLDWYVSPHVATCNDCSYSPSSHPVLRGGSFSNGEAYLLSVARVFNAPYYRAIDFGARCARTP